MYEFFNIEMEDLFYREQKILDNAESYLVELNDSETCDAEVLRNLTMEYARILRQLRRVTRISDRTTETLNSDKLDLLDKVFYDALTGIYNRRFLEENLECIIKSVARRNEMLSMLVIDVDFFKKYNDTYGHSMGDECLMIIAKTLKEGLLRPDDLVARYGGEEFVVVLPNTDESSLHTIANRLLENVTACNIPHEKNKPSGHVTISIGGTTCAAALTQNGADYIKRADQALYLSKQNGRNRYTFLEYKEDDDDKRRDGILQAAEGE